MVFIKIKALCKAKAGIVSTKAEIVSNTTRYFNTITT